MSEIVKCQHCGEEITNATGLGYEHEATGNPACDLIATPAQPAVPPAGEGDVMDFSVEAERLYRLCNDEDRTWEFCQEEIERALRAAATRSSISDEELDEIEKRCNAATPGPWHWRRDYEMPDGSKHWELSNPESDKEGKTIDASLILLLDKDDWLHRHAPSLPNWQFIAHARRDVPRLIAALRERK